jgi:predicted nucleic acid-binding protein
MIVVDASVVAFLFIEGEESGTVRKLYQADPEWVTPPIMNHEMLAILAAVGATEGDSSAVETIWREVRGLLGARQQIPDPVRSLRLAVEWGLSGYDAQYLALATQLRLPLLSCDGRLLDAVPGKVVTPESYLAILRATP